MTVMEAYQLPLFPSDKVCTKCARRKPFSAFSRKRAALDGYNGHCKECLAADTVRRKRTQAGRREPCHDEALRLFLASTARPEGDHAGCWRWTGAFWRNGYGRWTNRYGYSSYAHRAAWELWRGPIPDGLQACHRCDNKWCVNPACLFLGTQRDNARDCLAKGRSGFHVHPELRYNGRGEHHWMRGKPERVARGTRCGQAKLTDDLVRDARSRWPVETFSALAREYGVTMQAVRNAIRGRTWKHVD